MKDKAQKHAQSPLPLDQRIDEMLSSEKFLKNGQDKTDQHVIAFRVLGELFTVNPSGNTEPEFHRQIRRILPERSETEYQAMHQHALDEWTEAYGY